MNQVGKGRGRRCLTFRVGRQKLTGRPAAALTPSVLRDPSQMFIRVSARNHHEADSTDPDSDQELKVVFRLLLSQLMDKS